MYNVLVPHCSRKAFRYNGLRYLRLYCVVFFIQFGCFISYFFEYLNMQNRFPSFDFLHEPFKHSVQRVHLSPVSITLRQAHLTHIFPFLQPFLPCFREQRPHFICLNWSKVWRLLPFLRSEFEPLISERFSRFKDTHVLFPLLPFLHLPFLQVQHTEHFSPRFLMSRQAPWTQTFPSLQPFLPYFLEQRPHFVCRYWLKPALFLSRRLLP